MIEAVRHPATIIQLDEAGAQEKLGQVRQPILTVFVADTSVQACLSALSIPHELILSLLQSSAASPCILTLPEVPSLLLCRCHSPRLLTLLTSLSQHILAYQLPEAVLSLIQKQYWSIRELIHTYNIHDDIELHCANSRVLQNRVVSTVHYWKVRDTHRVLEMVRENKVLRVQDMYTLLKMYLDHPELKEQQIYQDKVNYLELNRLKKERELFEEMHERISQGDTLEMGDHIKNANLPHKKKAVLETLLKKVEMLEEIQSSRRKGQSEEKKYQNIKHLTLENLQIQYVEAANSATIDHWIKHMLGSLESAYNDISNHKDTKTLNTFAELYEHYSSILTQLMTHTSKNCRSFYKLTKMKKQLDWFYAYHQSLLKEELGSTIKYGVHQLRYLIRKKSVVIQKILIIMMVLVLIELLSNNTFLTVTLTLVAGIFYLKA